jgi:hypothetical protein
MFFVNDSIDARHSKIRRHIEKDAALGLILAAIDFEWTVRRAILALGKSPTKIIKEEVLATGRRSGLKHYEECWSSEVLPLHRNNPLSELIGEWETLRKAFFLRNKLVHGLATAGEPFARFRTDTLLAASRKLFDFSQEHDSPIYGRRIVRLKERSRCPHCLHP